MTTRPSRYSNTCTDSSETPLAKFRCYLHVLSLLRDAGVACTASSHEKHDVGEF